MKLTEKEVKSVQRKSLLRTTVINLLIIASCGMYLTSQHWTESVFAGIGVVISYLYLQPPLQLAYRLKNGINKTKEVVVNTAKILVLLGSGIIVVQLLLVDDWTFFGFAVAINAVAILIIAAFVFQYLLVMKLMQKRRTQVRGDKVQ